jgi:hypothetical protein
MNLTVAFIISLLLNIGLIYLFIRSFFSSKNKDSELAKSQKKIDILENRREKNEKAFNNKANSTMPDNDDDLAGGD